MSGNVQLTGYHPPQVRQDSKVGLSLPDRKVADSPTLRAFFASVGATLVVGVIVVSCIVSPNLIWGVIASVAIIGYWFFSSDAVQASAPNEPFTVLGNFTGLNNTGNNCFINAALQFLDGTLTYQKAISEKRLAILKQAHAGMANAIKAKSAVADAIDTNKIRLWLREQTKDDSGDEIRYKISEGGQEDASILIEYLFDTSRGLPIQNRRYKPHLDNKERVYDPKDVFKYLDIDIASSDFVENHNRFFARNIDPNLTYCSQFKVPPSDYFIRLNRFSFDGENTTKNNTPVKVPETFTVDTDHHSMSSPATYDVDGFIRHLGNTLNNGHYDAFRKVTLKGRTVYIHFNDSWVNEVSKEKFLKEAQQAYWIHVTKQDSPFSMKEFASRLIRTLIGMSPKKIPLCL